LQGAMSKTSWSCVIDAQKCMNPPEKKESKYEKTGSDGLKKINNIDHEMKKTLPVGKEKVTALGWGPNSDDKRLGVIDQLGSCMVWDTIKGMRMYGAMDSFAQSIAISPDETAPIMLVGGMKNATIMYKKEGDSAMMQMKKTWIVHDGYISSLHFLNANQYISSSGDADIRVFDISASPTDCVQVLRGHEKDAQSIKFPRDDAMNGKKDVFITCSSDKTVKMWDLRAGGAAMKTFFAQEGAELNACCISADGNLVACGGIKDKTYLFDARVGPELVGKYARNNQQTASCEFSKSGRELFIGHDDGAIIVWDIFGSGENKQYAKKIEAHTEYYKGTKNIDITRSRVQALEVGPLGYLASGGFDGNVKMWGSPAAA